MVRRACKLSEKFVGPGSIHCMNEISFFQCCVGYGGCCGMYGYQMLKKKRFTTNIVDG